MLIREKHDVELKGWGEKSKYQFHQRQSNKTLEDGEWSGVSRWSLDIRYYKGKEQTPECLNNGSQTLECFNKWRLLPFLLSLPNTLFFMFGVEPRFQDF